MEQAFKILKADFMNSILQYYTSFILLCLKSSNFRFFNFTRVSAKNIKTI